MDSVKRFMPDPRELLREFTKPFIVIVGGFAFVSTLIHLAFGQDPTVPVGRFLFDSFDALYPLAGRLIAIWLFYLVVYTLPGLYLRDLWRVSCVPEQLPAVSRRWGFRARLESSLSAGFAVPSSLVRIFPRCLPAWLATGWRAGDSVHLE